MRIVNVTRYPATPRRRSRSLRDPDLKAIPGRVDAVVVATPPAAVGEIVRQRSELGISRVWMHRSFGEGSVSLLRVHGH